MPVKKRATRSGPQEASPSLFSGEGTLFQRDDDDVYSPLGDLGSHRMELKGSTADGFAIVVYENLDEVLEQPIGVSMTLGYSDESASVHWPAVVETEVVYFAFRFDDGTNSSGATVRASHFMDRFVELYNQCTYSTLTGQDVVDKNDEWYEYLGAMNTVPLKQEGNPDDPVFDVCLDKRSQTHTPGSGTVCFAESVKFNNTVVVRVEKSRVVLDGHRFDQYGFRQEDPMSVVGQGVELTTKGVLLDSEERKMMLFGNEAGKVQELDLETGSVVQEYRPRDEGFNVNSLTYAQHQATAAPNVYTCLAPNVAFNIDTRLNPRQCVISEEGKGLRDYAIQSKAFTCHATSKAGHLAIGSADGKIRLYSGPPGSRKETGKFNPKTAKTALETKTPITSLAMTADGHYIVATSDGFALLISTRYVDEGTSCDGFTSRMGKNKPQPIRLQPSPQQVAQMGGESQVHITNAQFAASPDGTEECVTASCGSFVLTWSLKAIIAAEESKRRVPCGGATMGTSVVRAATNLPSTVTYVTRDNLAMVPLESKDAATPSSRAWRWGN